MLQWAQLHSKGAGVDEAAEKAASTVMTGEGASPLTPRRLLQWLRDYVVAGGRISLSQRGHHAKTESYLDDPEIKSAAVSWLRRNVQASRKKPVAGEHPTPPLNVPRFLEYVNNTLLMVVLKASCGKLKPIAECTACCWLHALGFSYESHKKMIFFDGHERKDVVTDRTEKLVILLVLKESKN